MTAEELYQKEFGNAQNVSHRFYYGQNSIFSTAWY
jgi:hypothetical protein